MAYLRVFWDNIYGILGIASFISMMLYYNSGNNVDAHNAFVVGCLLWILQDTSDIRRHIGI